MRIVHLTKQPGRGSWLTEQLSKLGGVLFPEPEAHELVSIARKEEPSCIIIDGLSGFQKDDLVESLRTLSQYPETRWVPTLLFLKPEDPNESAIDLLNSGATQVIRSQDPESLLIAQLSSFLRACQKLLNLRSSRMTDEQTGVYHRSFLEDQLEVLCRKQRRDGTEFCLLFLELQGDEQGAGRSTSRIAATVRGADLFGRWEGDIFAILLPASQPEHALELASRCQLLLEKEGMTARAALVCSASVPLESDGLVEAALNTLDQAWQEEKAFLWWWDGKSNTASPLTETERGQGLGPPSSERTRP